MDWNQYIFPCTGSTIGPCFEFRDFDEFLNLKSHWKQIPTHKLVVPALKRISHFFGFVVLYLLTESVLAGRLLNLASYENVSILSINVALFGVCFSKTCMLFSGFCAQEANQIVSGFGYRPAQTKEKEGKIVKIEENLNSLRTIQALKVLYSRSMNGVSTNWNLTIHMWLKYYIMLRMIDRKAPRGKVQILPFLCTFALSGVWHAIDPGQISAFVCWAMTDLISKMGPKTGLASTFRALLPSQIKRGLQWYLNWQMTCYISMPFMTNKSEVYLRFYRAYNWIPHYITVAVFLLCFILPKQKRDQKDKVEQRGESEAKKEK